MSAAHRLTAPAHAVETHGALAGSPERPAHANFRAGVEHWNSGRRDAAVAALDAALREDPDSPEVLAMAAYVLDELGKPEPAFRFYRKSLTLNAAQPTAWSNLGKLCFRFARYDEALSAFDAALELRPDLADVWNSRAGVLRKLGRLAESAAAAQHALRLEPAFAEAAVNLGNALLKLDSTSEALAAYQRARSIDPAFASAICGEALSLRALGRIDEALAAFAAAEALGCREATSGRGCLQLAMGDFEHGWEGYEARWIEGRSLAEALGARFPTWRGPGARGDRVLVLNDHGLGDTIQFVRYLPMMLAAGVSTTFACPRRLHRLLGAIAGIELIEDAQIDRPFDAQIALSSLPHAFSTRLETVPAQTPYLAADEALQTKWRDRIGQRGFRIGVVWQGNPDPEVDIARSFPLRALGALADLPEVRLISLQKGAGLEQLASLPTAMHVETLGPDFDFGEDAFVDTAAAMMCLDLIVTCDTSIAHLAGALARPVWVALKSDAEWRWMTERSDSPWYPTMRLFRQSRRGDWDELFQRLRQSLGELLQRRQAERLVAIPGAVGELIDKITILEIKALRAVGEARRGNVRRELDLLEQCLAEIGIVEPEIDRLRRELSDVNGRLWEIEDEIRKCEKAGIFDGAFIDLARAVYKTNDQRAALKYRINQLSRSAIVEEKCYA